MFLKKKNKHKKTELPYNWVIPLLGIYPDKIIIQRYMHPKIHCSTIYNSQHMEATKMSTDRWTDKDDNVLCALSRWLFVTPWTVAHQAPLSMEFSRQEFWSGLPFPSPMINHYIFLKGILDRLHKRFFLKKKAFIDLIAPRGGNTLQLRNHISV